MSCTCTNSLLVHHFTCTNMPREGYDTITVKQNVKDEINKLAEAENRSVMNMAEVLLLKAIKSWKGKKKSG